MFLCGDVVVAEDDGDGDGDRAGECCIFEDDCSKGGSITVFPNEESGDGSEKGPFAKEGGA